MCVEEYGGTRWHVRRWYERVDVDARAMVALEAAVAQSRWGYGKGF
ncbi:hypothetical protein ES332_A07G150700v1 [Gossypium tomentosum]|uniref:Uncharacterized protein n=1 Tax=Gossypium tomentosum TaxID=34277 RepID=A0A5D2PTM7_GOSTO|nr:hypothetical protein ES332_A07G150700v1 [Gossypium tomentosum]